MSWKPIGQDGKITLCDGRAIDKFSEDLLGRKQFALFLAEAIINHPGNESLTLAINAPWGSGKTSLKNMVVDLLKEKHDNRVVTLTFNPWEWASQNQVAEAFFAEISKQLEIKDSSEAAKDAAKRLRMFGRYLGLAGQIIGPAGIFTEPVLPGSSLLTFAIGQSFSKAKEIARESSEDMEKIAELAKKSLPEVKDEIRVSLSKYLSEQRKIILVVIDDIDRLSPEEIRLVFQMVRVNADFPALMFFLLYDEEFVTKALEEYFGNDSRKFLEKIVQFQLGLPVMLENQIRDYVMAGLEKMFSERPAFQRILNIERLKNLWDDGIGYYISNLRHACRLLSSYQFHIGIFKSAEAEVNPIDLFLIELLRLFEPKAHLAVQKAADQLFYNLSVTMVVEIRNEDFDPWQKSLDNISKDEHGSVKQPLRRLLVDLFPQRFAIDIPFSTLSSHQEATERRVCSILYFSRYFRFTIDEDDIPDSSITHLEKLVGEPSKFIIEMRAIAGNGQLALALTKLLARESSLLSAKPIEMITELCDFIENFEPSPQPKHYIKIWDACHWLVTLQLPPNLTSKERLGRLSEAIGKSNAIHFPIRIAEAEARTHHKFINARENQCDEIAAHLKEPELKIFYEFVAGRLENEVHLEKTQSSPQWLDSFRWYIQFFHERMIIKAEFFLSYTSVVNTLLRIVIDDSTLRDYEDLGERIAQIVQMKVQTALGLEQFDKALDKEEAAILQIDESMADRFRIYRDIRKNFSHLLKPAAQENS